ncbi:hypothetical protein BGZ95_008742, partial [Linnemannia exigua]
NKSGLRRTGHMPRSSTQETQKQVHISACSATMTIVTTTLTPRCGRGLSLPLKMITMVPTNTTPAGRTTATQNLTIRTMEDF